MVPAAILRNRGTAVAICLLTVGVDAEHPIENLQLSCTGWRRAVEVLDPEVLAGWDERSDKRVGPLILPQVFAWRPILGVSGRQRRAGLVVGRQVQWAGTPSGTRNATGGNGQSGMLGTVSPGRVCH